MNPYLTDVIGTKVNVLKHSDPSFVGVRGRILDETKNILIVETEKGQKILPKTKGVVLFDDKKANLEKMRFRPEDKMKKLRRKGRL
jgi:ribonuclease P protein subunit POP4